MESVEKTVKVSQETHERLTKLGVKGETYEDIIVSLLEETEAIPHFKKAIEELELGLKTYMNDTRYSGELANAARSAIAALNCFVEIVESR